MDVGFWLAWISVGVAAAGRMGGLFWLAGAGIGIAIVAAALMVRAIAVEQHRRLAPLLAMLSAGVVLAASAATVGVWWPVILTLHCSAAAVVFGYAVRYQRRTRPVTQSMQLPADPRDVSLERSDRRDAVSDSATRP